MYKYFFKRFLDFWIALIVLICISPILLVVTVWLHFANKGAGAYFLQERPGISGWAQCHGRNAISWTEKFKLDVWYVDHLSLMTDLKVIWITILKVLKCDGISQEGNATMEAFNGHN